MANLNQFVSTLPASYRPATLSATPSPAPAGGVGAAAGAWDTAANRDAAIATINALVTRLSQLEAELKEIGVLA